MRWAMIMLLVLGLVGCGGAAATATPVPAKPTVAPFGITNLVTAKSITSTSAPAGAATSFPVGVQMFITYVANNVQPGQRVDLKLFRDGQAVDLTGATTTFDRAQTYYGYFTYTPKQAAQYQVELYFNGEGQPSQTTTFTVTP